MPRESEIISRIKARADASRKNDLLIGIGDDAAVVRNSAASNLIMCSDLVVEGVHFRRDWSDPFSIGYKALAATISDVAAMGGVPRFALVSLALPRETAADFIDDLIEGLFSIADAYDVAIVGGDTSSSPGPLFIDTVLAGECEDGRAVTRGGAKEDDLIFVTGSLGASEVGLKLLEQQRASYRDDRSDGEKRFEEERAEAVSHHTRPEPRVAFGAAIGRAGFASAMIDISDGLSTDLKNLTTASNCGAVINSGSIPVAGCVKLLARDIGALDPLSIALKSGEEYELLFTTPQKNRSEIKALSAQLGVPISEIGKIIKEQRLLIDNGKLAELAIAGWEHLI